MTSVPLRKTVRKIPEFSSLTTARLDEAIEHMICQEYQPDEMIWHIKHPIDFFGILQSGEILVEYRLRGRVVRSVRLAAGDYVRPRDPKVAGHPMSILARAVTNTRIHTLQRQQLELLQSKWRDRMSPRRIRSRISTGLWAVLVALLIVILSREDVVRIGSGLLYMRSFQIEQSVGDFQESLRLLKYAQTLDPNAVFAYNQEGYYSFQNQDLENARSAFETAVRIEQTNVPALNNLAVTCYSLEQTPNPATLLQKAVAHDPDRAELRYNLGVVLVKQNKEAQALRQFKEASYINPGWALPYMQQAALYLQLGDDLNAEQAAHKALRLDPNQYPAHVILAIALYNQGKTEEALPPIEQALQIDPDHLVSRFYYALILSRLGKVEMASPILQELLETAKDPKELSRIQAEIEVLEHSSQDFAVGSH